MSEDFIFEHAARLNPDFVYWRGRDGDSGLQAFVPVDLLSATTIQDATRIDLGIRSGYVFSKSFTPNFGGRVSTITDTVVKAQVAYEGWQSFQPFVVMNVNLPTGKQTLRGTEKNAVMDRDLVPQTRFGEGWNFNPGFGVTIPLASNMVASGGASYNVRRAYVPDGDLGFEYDPGNQWIGTVGLTYVNQAYLGSVNAILTQEATSTLSGFNYFKPGRSLTVTASGMHL